MEASEVLQPSLDKSDTVQICREALFELRRAKKKFPSWPQHIVARAAIVGEEAGELVRASLNYKYEAESQEKREFWMKEMEKEALQVVAMGIRFIEALRKEK